MKKYILSKIKKIKLDQEQAILHICAIGGGYLQDASASCIFQGTEMASCGTSVRGKNLPIGFYLEGSSAPS